MSKISYIIRCIAGMDYANLFRTVGRVHKKSGKGRIALAVDIVRCGLKYGAGYTDYELNAWYDLNAEQRKTYITRGINNSIIKKCNDPSSYHLFNNKDEFNEIFDDCLDRRWIKISDSSPEEFNRFEKFLDGLKYIIIKPLDECCGRGVEKLCVDDFSSAQELFDRILHSRTGEILVEECIVQHSEMSRIYPCSVNTLRIVTLLDDSGDPHIIYAVMRMGNNGSVVDNLNAGGITAPIDVEKGLISGVGFDKKMNYYDTHPYTNVKIEGFKIPLWEEAKALVLESSKRVPSIRYVGWDVAITADKAIFVEANQHPGHDLVQMPIHTPDKVGVLPIFRKYIDI